MQPPPPARPNQIRPVQASSAAHSKRARRPNPIAARASACLRPSSPVFCRGQITRQPTIRSMHNPAVPLQAFVERRWIQPSCERASGAAAQRVAKRERVLDAMRFPDHSRIRRKRTNTTSSSRKIPLFGGYGFEGYACICMMRRNDPNNLSLNQNIAQTQLSEPSRPDRVDSLVCLTFRMLAKLHSCVSIDLLK